MDLAILEKQLNMQFTDKKILKQAFIHASYVNEHGLDANGDNERLEFLGDAVLELAVSDYLFTETPLMSEGEMTKMRAFLVRESTLSTVAKSLYFGDFLLLGKGEENTGGRERPSILADVFEAFLGALYVDQGFARVRMFLADHLYVHAHTSAIDYKTTLQEIVQQNNSSSVTYTIVEERGPAHHKEFIARAHIEGSVTTTGIGRSKKEAEQQAAKEAIDQLEST